MGRAALACLLLLLLGACGDEPKPAAGPVETITEFGANPQRLELEGGGASVQPPAGAWLTLSASPGSARWYERLRRASDGVLLQASVFPRQRGEAPALVLPRALDAFVRGLGTDGFGQSGREAGVAWGAPVAGSAFAATIDGQAVSGHARLLAVDADQWALAIGLAPKAAGPTALALVRAYAASLEPSEVTFYARTFSTPEDLARVAVRPVDEEPITQRELMSVQLAIEAGSGVRFPVGSAAALLDALAEEARTGKPASRASFRETTAVLEKTKAMEPAERERGLRSIGQRILKAMFERVLTGYKPAQRYKAIWDALARPVVGEMPEGMSAAALRSLHEMSAFLASVAADREVEAEEGSGARLLAALKARWPELDAPARKDLAQAGRPWAALRYAWDHADAAGRGAFRQAILAALVTPDEASEVAALPDDRARVAWMHAHQAAADDYLQRAAALSAPSRAALLEHLGVDGSGYHLGW